jgi:hypothetical protein
MKLLLSEREREREGEMMMIVMMMMMMDELVVSENSEMNKN